MNGGVTLQLLAALIETMAIEAAVALLMKMDVRWLFPCLLGNLLTNPLLNLLYNRYLSSFGEAAPLPSWLVLAGLEIGAVLYEAFIYDGILLCGRKDALRVSLLCNAASFGAGLLIFQVIGRL